MKSTRLRMIAALVFGLSGLASPNIYAASALPDAKLRDLLREAVNDTSSFDDRFHAEVWLMDMSIRLAPIVRDPQQRIELLKLVHAEASRANLAPELVLAVIDVESYFNSWAISSVGARGLMQVMPFWLKEIGRPDDNLFDVRTNLRMGCTILRYYIDMEKGKLTRALARYNGSLNSYKYPDKVLGKLRSRWRPG